MDPQRSLSKGGYANLFNVPSFSNLESPNPSSAFAASSSVSSTPHSGFGTSNCASTSEPAFGFPTRSHNSFFITASTASSMLSSSVSPFDNTRTTTFGRHSNVSETPTWLSNSGASKPSLFGANPFSASPFNNKSGQPPLSSQCGGSKITPYSASKMVDEDCMKIISISAMPTYGVKSHEELRWEDHQQTTKGNPFSASLPSSLVSQQEGSGVALYIPTEIFPNFRLQISISAIPITEGGNGDPTGAFSSKTNISIPSASPTQISFFSKPLNVSSEHAPPFPNVNTNVLTSEQPSPFFTPQNFSRYVQFPPLPRTNPFLQTSAQPSSFCSKPLRPSSHQFPSISCTNTAPTGPSMFQPTTSTPFKSTSIDLVSGESRIEQTTISDPADRIVPVKVPFGVLQYSKSQWLTADHATTPATSTQIGISSIPEDPHGGINHPIPPCGENKKSGFVMNVPEPVIEKDDPEENARVVGALPKLTRSDYYTKPLISELEAKERMDPGFCGRVRGFVIGRHGYGQIEFEGETDIRGLDLDSAVEFTTREVAVYEDESIQVDVGEGLNKPALVTLLKVDCEDNKTGRVFVDGDEVAKYEEMLKLAAQMQEAEFVSYDAVKGEWKFRVHHF